MKIVMKEEISFLEEELKRIDTQIKAYNYGGKLDKLEEIMKLWELRKGILEEIGEETSKVERSFLEEELKRIKTQIKAYNYGGSKEIVDKVIKLFELRKTIVEEIKKTTKVKARVYSGM